ncbi:hypothetical protein N9F42_01745 [Pseudomonadales bacterium]|nr:hypothetical protein [Pseudomonadales bacterium]
MNFDRQSSIINTKELRITKLSKKFWSALVNAGHITDLKLCSCDGFSENISEISKLNNLQKLSLAQLDISDRIKLLILPSTVTSLSITAANCSDWSLLPVLPHIKDFKYKKMVTSDVVKILMKLPNVDAAELKASNDDELTEIKRFFQGDTKLKSLQLFINDDISLSCLEDVAEELVSDDLVVTVDYDGHIAHDEINRVMREAGVRYRFRPR